VIGRRWTVAFLAVVVWVGSAPAVAQEGGEDQIAWLATGDSYSSGEGVAGNQGPCAQSDLAYGRVAASSFPGTSIFTACTGLLAADYFGDVTGDAEGSLYDWSQELAPGQRYDVITLTFGGNDIGFEGIVTDCLGFFPSGWDDIKLYDDCDVTELELQNRIDKLVTDYQVRIHPTDQNLVGSLTDFYREVADQQLTPGGQLYVLGYPKLFAPSEEWGLWQGLRCNGITRGDANMLTRVADYLDAKLKVAVEAADDGTGRIVYLPVINLFRNGSHELCGNGDDWINGSITVERDVRRAGFHPTAAGHQQEAQLLLSHLQDPVSGIMARRPTEPSNTSPAIGQSGDDFNCGTLSKSSIESVIGSEIGRVEEFIEGPFNSPPIEGSYGFTCFLEYAASPVEASGFALLVIQVRIGTNLEDLKVTPPALTQQQQAQFEALNSLLDYLVWSQLWVASEAGGPDESVEVQGASAVVGDNVGLLTLSEDRWVRVTFSEEVGPPIVFGVLDVLRGTLAEAGTS
jgi:lysophospholipase L1-like esterase